MSVPYHELVGSEDPLSLMAANPDRVAEVVRPWDAARWMRSYAPGKWTGADVVLHLAHDEIGWGNRIRLALTVDDYVVQPYDGAPWVAAESPADPQEALDAFLALRRLNVSLCRKATTESRARTFRHPEFGAISVEWIMRLLAGHDLHHLKHLQAIASL